MPIGPVPAATSDGLNEAFIAVEGLTIPKPESFGPCSVAS
jgi:hypothetical protein